MAFEEDGDIDKGNRLTWKEGLERTEMGIPLQLAEYTTCTSYLVINVNFMLVE